MALFLLQENALGFTLVPREQRVGVAPWRAQGIAESRKGGAYITARRRSHYIGAVDDRKGRRRTSRYFQTRISSFTGARLMERPWMKFHTRDWLDSKELRRCSPMSRAVLADLMCLAHEGIPYGHLSDRIGPLSMEYMAARCVVSLKALNKALTELKNNDRISQGEPLFIPRMVSDEALRVRRSEGGKASIGHPNTHPPNNKQGYPSFEIDSRVRVCADSGSGSSEKKSNDPALNRNGFIEDINGGVDIEVRFQQLKSKHPGSQSRVVDCKEAYRAAIMNALNPATCADQIDSYQELWIAYWKATNRHPLGLLNWLTGGDCLTAPPSQQTEYQSPYREARDDE